MIATLLIPIVTGIIDYGTLFQKRQSVQDSTRAGARTGAATCAILSTTAIDPNCDKGNRIDQDAMIMQAIRARLGSARSQVTKVVVYASVKYDSDGVTLLNGRMPAVCAEQAAPGGVPLFCNVYGPNELALVDTLSPAALAAAFSCDPSTGLARYWCPTTRERAKRADDAYIGVEVHLDHPHVIRLFGSDLIIVYRSIFRLDPNPAVPDRPSPLPAPPPPSTTTTTTIAPPPTTTTTTIAPPPTTTTTPPPTTTTEAPTTTTTVAPPPTSSTAAPATTTTLAPPPTTTTIPPPTTTTVAPPTTTAAPPPPTTTTTTTTKPPNNGRRCC